MPSKRKAESLDVAGDGPADNRAKLPAISPRQGFARADVSWMAEVDHLVTKKPALATETNSSSVREVDKNSELGAKQVREVEAEEDSKKMVSTPRSPISEAKHVLQTCQGCNLVPKTCICYAKAYPTEKDIANGASRGSFIDLRRVPQFQGQFRDCSSGVTQYIQPFIELNSLAAQDREQPVASGRSRVDMYYERLSCHEGDLDRIFSR